MHPTAVPEELPPRVRARRRQQVQRRSIHRALPRPRSRPQTSTRAALVQDHERRSRHLPQRRRTAFASRARRETQGADRTPGFTAEQAPAATGQGRSTSGRGQGPRGYALAGGEDPRRGHGRRPAPAQRGGARQRRRGSLREARTEKDGQGQVPHSLRHSRRFLPRRRRRRGRFVARRLGDPRGDGARDQGTQGGGAATAGVP